MFPKAKELNKQVNDRLAKDLLVDKSADELYALLEQNFPTVVEEINEQLEKAVNNNYLTTTVPCREAAIPILEELFTRLGYKITHSLLSKVKYSSIPGPEAIICIDFSNPGPGIPSREDKILQDFTKKFGGEK